MSVVPAITHDPLAPGHYVNPKPFDASAAEAIARNPGAAGEIRVALMLGLVLIESLVIYVLLISLILVFLKPFGG